MPAAAYRKLTKKLYRRQLAVSRRGHGGAIAIHTNEVTMKRILLSTTTAVGVLAVVALSGVANANSDKCNVPTAERQTTEALKQKLEGEGWKVRRIKSDDGCYEVYGFDDKGRRVEAYFDPKTFVLVKLDDED
jgi:hypothetical protein